MTKPLSFMLLTSLLFGVCAQSSRAQTKPGRAQPERNNDERPTESAGRDGDFPPHVRQLPNGGGSLHAEPSVPVLSAGQEAKLLTALTALPSFSRYIYSGCHDRAHALWVLLPDDLKTYTAKVWLFAPGATTLAFNDALTVPSLGDKSPRWGYHVALMYKTASGVRVLDPAMDGWKSAPPSLADWLGVIRTPYGTVMTTLDPKLYLFYSLPKSANTNLTNNTLSAVINNGQFFECVGGCRENANIEEALARDDVGAKLAADGGCADLRNELRNPGTLLDKLKGTDAPPECAALISTFKERRDYWRRVIWRP